jgi:hypothetical protein
MLNSSAKKFLSIFSATFFFLISIDARADEPRLGDAPHAPHDVSNLPGAGVRSKTVTGGFSVDTGSREQVRSFYNAIYPASSGVPINTTADVSSCTPGTNSMSFQNAVLLRINWFRAMAGLPASVTLDAGDSIQDQAGALMMSANTNIQHTGIPPTWHCFSTAGTNAANNSNLALGNAGADAITAYIWDFGAGNYEVGHRRWILYPQTQVMGTGDLPRTNIITATQTNLYFAANATWVFDANLNGPRPATRQPFVSWPPAGYVPYQLVYPQWSFALSNMDSDFSSATVTMKSNGVSVAISYQQYVTGYGENTLVWYPSALNPNTSATIFPFSGTDTVYTVTITNILYNGATVGYTYNVTLFDPAVPGADYFPPIISGTNQPSINVANPYTFTALTNVTGYQWLSFLRTLTNFNDGAESGLGNFIVNTTAGYSVQDSSTHASGSYSFHLAHPSTSPTDQILTINQIFVPKTNTTFTYKSKLGYAADGETAKVQISTDYGTTWTNLFSETGNLSGNPVETSFVSRSATLTNYAGLPLQIRFDYVYSNGFSYYPSASSGYGWNLDDIIVTNYEVATAFTTNFVTTTNFSFAPAQTGNYSLQVGGILYSQFVIGGAPIKQVTAIVGPLTITLTTPSINGTQVQLNFSVSGPISTFKLLQANQLNSVWTTNAGAIFTTNILGSSYRFTTTNGPATRFYRIQSP